MKESCLGLKTDFFKNFAGPFYNLIQSTVLISLMSLQYRNHDYYLIPKIIPYALENLEFGIGGCDYYVRIYCTWLKGMKARLKSKLVNSTCNI